MAEKNSSYSIFGKPRKGDTKEAFKARMKKSLRERGILGEDGGINLAAMKATGGAADTAKDAEAEDPKAKSAAVSDAKGATAEPNSVEDSAFDFME